ncbi:putative J domain-containing protein C63.03 [Ceratocystis lukuohia]|uniref:J domain-containing protein C63.03 n=1 Tax=Ceratocystis lukuohia TaxID=2019550 RepID=A0ABR4MTP2_9PEZI
MPSKEPSSSGRSKAGRSSRRSERSNRHGTSSRAHGAANEDPAYSNSPYQQSVRAAESRFSLTDQFATTAREFEFGFDDASSVFTKVTDVADSHPDPPPPYNDEAEGPAAVEDAVGPRGAWEDVEEDFDYVEPSHYDILCLPRNSALTQDQIRRAFYRQFMLLYPEAHASKYRAMASNHFFKSQQAYETLMDPQRRAEYDVLGEDCEDAEALVHGHYDSAVEGKLRARMQQVVYGTSEIGVRIDASKLYNQLYRQLSKRRTPTAANLAQSMKPLDYALSQSFTVGVPVHRVLPLAQLRAAKKRLGGMMAKLRSDKGKEKSKKRSRDREREKASAAAGSSNYYMAIPTVTVAGSLYGLVDGLTQANVSSSLLTDRVQPLLPLTIPRHRIVQLGELKCTPLVAVRVRQEIIHRARAAERTESAVGTSSSAAVAGSEERWTKSAIEVETDVIPERSLTARVSHTFLLPYSSVPWNIEASATNGRYVTGGIPRLGMGMYRKIGPGTAFFRADSGDWRFGNGRVCNFFGQFAKESKKWFYADFQFPLKTTPSIEIGYKTTPCERWTTTNYADIPRGESGIRGMDRESSFAGRGSWAVSVSAMPSDAFAGYLRYSRDLPYLAPTQNPSRIEAELCGSNSADYYLALRNLWQVGNFARLGLEVSVSAHHVHLSLYWARLSHAISLPVLVAPRTMISDKMVAWGAVVPFVTVALGQFGRRWLNRSRVAKKMARNQEAVRAYVDQKRVDAEEVEYLIGGFVETHQKREAKKGGLVILSAKYGVKEGTGSNAVWGGGEVADVRVAVAALVDGDGRLEIPYGVRKSHIPGFWDPMPLQEKVLHVRYMYRGREAVVEVRGKEGLVLPPV